jgi:serine/threonine protein phosphatase PrpC
LAFGDLAAGAAIAALHAAAPRDGSSLQSALFTANNAVRTFAQGRAVAVGSTLVALLVTESGAWVVSAGDSRAWMLDADGLTALTQDETAAAAAGVELGDPRFRELSRHLDRFLGEGPVLDAVASLVPLRHRRARLVLTTDGVHDVISPEVIERALLEKHDPARAASQLVDAANAAGTHDDASAVVVDVVRTVEGI